MNETIVNILPTGLRAYLARSSDAHSRLKYSEYDQYRDVEEIRLRAGRPVILYMGRSAGELQTDYTVSARELQEALEYITGFSIYAYESEIKEGFITIKGGHRVGVAGKVICQGDGITTISPISSINIRVSRQVIGCADKVMPHIVNGDKYYNTLIISPPGAGKTTLLRDIVRQLSDIYKFKVSIVDERSEIASSYKGVPQNDVGIRSDVYDCCHKSDGVMLMIRAMSPQIVAVDELGGEADMRAMEEASRCGCRILATAHGDAVDHKLLDESIFDRYIVIESDRFRTMQVYDRQGRRLL